MRKRLIKMAVASFIFSMIISGCSGVSCNFPNWPDPPGPKVFTANNVSIPFVSGIPLSGYPNPVQQYLIPGTLNIGAMKSDQTLRLYSYLETKNVPLQIWDGNSYIPVTDKKAKKVIVDYLEFSPAVQTSKLDITWENPESVAPVLAINMDKVLVAGTGTIHQLTIKTQVGDVPVFMGGANSADNLDRRIYIREGDVTDVTAPSVTGIEINGQEVKLTVTEELGSVYAGFVSEDYETVVGAFFEMVTKDNASGAITYKIKPWEELPEGVVFNLMVGKSVDELVQIGILFVGTVPVAGPQPLSQDMNGNVIDCGVGTEIPFGADPTSLVVCTYGPIGG